MFFEPSPNVLTSFKVKLHSQVVEDVFKMFTEPFSFGHYHMYVFILAVVVILLVLVMVLGVVPVDVFLILSLTSVKLENIGF